MVTVGLPTFEELDIDGDGVISREEYLLLLADKVAVQQEEPEENNPEESDDSGTRDARLGVPLTSDVPDISLDLSKGISGH